MKSRFLLTVLFFTNSVFGQKLSDLILFDSLQKVVEMRDAHLTTLNITPLENKLPDHLIELRYCSNNCILLKKEIREYWQGWITKHQSKSDKWLTKFVKKPVLVTITKNYFDSTSEREFLSVREEFVRNMGFDDPCYGCTSLTLVDTPTLTFTLPIANKNEWLEVTQDKCETWIVKRYFETSETGKRVSLKRSTILGEEARALISGH